MPSWVHWALRGFLLLLSLWLAWRLLGVLLLLAVTLLVTAMFFPVARWLEDRRVPHLLAVSLCFLGLLGLFGGFIAFWVPVAIVQGQQFIEISPRLLERLSGAESILRSHFPFLPKIPDLAGQASGLVAMLLQRSLDITGQVINVSLETVSVLFLAFFFLKDGPLLFEQVLRLLPTESRPEVRLLTRCIGERLGMYVLGRLLLMTFVWIATSLGLALLGVPYAILLGLLAGLLDIIPYLGPWLAAIPAVILAFNLSWATGLWVIGIYVLVQQLEAYLFAPFVFERSVGLHPAWVLIALLIGAELMGIVGLILAIPAASTIQILLDELFFSRQEEPKKEA